MSAEREGPEAGRNPEADRPTEDQREAAADAIRERLRSEPLQGSKQLLEFARNYKAHEPNTVLLDNALATMGAGLPSAMAAHLVHPDRKVELRPLP